MFIQTALCAVLNLVENDHSLLFQIRCIDKESTSIDFEFQQVS